MEDGDHPVEEDDGDAREQMDGETGSEGGRSKKQPNDPLTARPQLIAN